MRLARWLLASAIFGSTMAIGALHVGVLLVVTLVLLASAGLAWWGAEPMRARRSASLVLWVAVALTTWTALSVLPMPAAWLAHLSPHAADVWARCLIPLGRPGPAWVTLSLDPGATRVQVLRGVAYTLAFVAASRISARREGVVFLERALIVTALALAAAAMIHPAVGAEKVFGIYTPRRDPGLRHVAPILNSNVLSGYLNIGLALIVGQLLTPRSPWPRTVLASLTVALLAVQVWIASRGGVLASGVVVVLAVWMSRPKAAEMQLGMGRLLVPVLLAVAGLGAIVVASSEGAMDELATMETSKLDLSREAFRVLPDFPVFGVGRGAFESVFPAYRSDPGFIVYTHPENVVAQWVIEWGLLAGIALLVLVFALQPASALARSPQAAGAWAALVGVAVQNLVDFGSEYPAVVIALAACAGIVTGGTRGTSETGVLDVWARRPVRLVACLVLASALACGLALGDSKWDVFDDRVALHASALDASLTKTDFESKAALAIQRHPAEPYLPFAGALWAARTHDPSFLAWLERTLDRAIVYGPAHLLLARWLTPRSPSQARLEYRLTLEQGPELFASFYDAVPLLVHSYDDALELLPRGPSRAEWVRYVATTVGHSLPATSRRLDDVVAAIDPNDVTYLMDRAGESLVDVLEPSAAPWCAGEQRSACVRDGLAQATRLSKVAPDKCVGHSIHARLVLESGQPGPALTELRAATDTVTDRLQCLEDLVRLSELASSEEMLTQALERVAHAGCSTSAECVANLEFVATHEMSRSNERRALAVLQRARGIAPDDDGLLERVAALAAKLELHADALKSYESLAARHPGDARWPSAIASERLALVMGAIPY